MAKPLFESVAAQVRQIAAAHGVTYAATDADAWAGAVTRLSGDDIALDNTELLLIALQRAGHLTNAESLRLQHAHLMSRAP